MDYQQEAKIIEEIYDEYHELINEASGEISKRKEKLAELETEIEQTKEVSLTEISFLQKKLTDLNIALADSEDVEEILPRLQEEVEESKFLLSDEVAKSKQEILACDEQIKIKQQELNSTKQAYNDRINKLKMQIQEKELLVGEVSADHLSNNSISKE